MAKAGNSNLISKKEREAVRRFSSMDLAQLMAVRDRANARIDLLGSGNTNSLTPVGKKELSGLLTDLPLMELVIRRKRRASKNDGEPANPSGRKANKRVAQDRSREQKLSNQAEARLRESIKGDGDPLNLSRRAQQALDDMVALSAQESAVRRARDIVGQDQTLLQKLDAERNPGDAGIQETIDRELRNELAASGDDELNFPLRAADSNPNRPNLNSQIGREQYRRLLAEEGKTPFQINQIMKALGVVGESDPVGEDLKRRDTTRMGGVSTREPAAGTIGFPSTPALDERGNTRLAVVQRDPSDPSKVTTRPAAFSKDAQVITDPWAPLRIKDEIEAAAEKRLRTKRVATGNPVSAADRLINLVADPANDITFNTPLPTEQSNSKVKTYGDLIGQLSLSQNPRVRPTDRVVTIDGKQFNVGQDAGNRAWNRRIGQEVGDLAARDERLAAGIYLDDDIAKLQRDVISRVDGNRVVVTGGDGSYEIVDASIHPVVAPGSQQSNEARRQAIKDSISSQFTNNTPASESALRQELGKRRDANRQQFSADQEALAAGGSGKKDWLKGPYGIRRQPGVGPISAQWLSPDRVYNPESGTWSLDSSAQVVPRYEQNFDAGLRNIQRLRSVDETGSPLFNIVAQAGANDDRVSFSAVPNDSPIGSRLPIAQRMEELSSGLDSSYVDPTSGERIITAPPPREYTDAERFILNNMFDPDDDAFQSLNAPNDLDGELTITPEPNLEAKLVRPVTGISDQANAIRSVAIDENLGRLTAAFNKDAAFKDNGIQIAPIRTVEDLETAVALFRDKSGNQIRVRHNPADPTNFQETPAFTANPSLEQIIANVGDQKDFRSNEAIGQVATALAQSNAAVKGGFRKESVPLVSAVGLGADGRLVSKGRTLPQDLSNVVTSLDPSLQIAIARFKKDTGNNTPSLLDRAQLPRDGINVSSDRFNTGLGEAIGGERVAKKSGGKTDVKAVLRKKSSKDIRDRIFKDEADKALEVRDLLVSQIQASGDPAAITRLSGPEFSTENVLAAARKNAEEILLTTPLSQLAKQVQEPMQGVAPRDEETIRRVMDRQGIPHHEVQKARASGVQSAYGWQGQGFKGKKLAQAQSAADRLINWEIADRTARPSSLAAGISPAGRAILPTASELLGGSRAVMPNGVSDVLPSTAERSFNDQERSLIADPQLRAALAKEPDWHVAPPGLPPSFSKKVPYVNPLTGGISLQAGGPNPATPRSPLGSQTPVNVATDYLPSYSPPQDSPDQRMPEPVRMFDPIKDNRYESPNFNDPQPSNSNLFTSERARRRRPSATTAAPTGLNSPLIAALANRQIGSRASNERMRRRGAYGALGAGLAAGAIGLIGKEQERRKEQEQDELIAQLLAGAR